jgi:peptide/nickel transport system permease protein/oligopeptide transport system permease protein
MTTLRFVFRNIRSLMAMPGPALALLFLTVIVFTATFADLLGFDPFKQNIARALEGPSTTYWFGTDELGRDILSRVVHGARTSLITAGGSVVIAALIGVPMGLIAGFFGGWRDSVMMRFVDVMMALPGILFAMTLIAVLGRGQIAALVAVGVSGIPNFARIVRAQVLTLRKRDYVTAVESFGGTSTYNMFRTVLPNSWPPILVQIVVLSSVAILLEASLAFLGIGVPPPQPSWGEMLRSGKSFLYDSPTYAILPGIALTLTILSFDTLGRGLQTVLENPRRSAAKPKAESAAS